MDLLGVQHASNIQTGKVCGRDCQQGHIHCHMVKQHATTQHHKGAMNKLLGVNPMYEPASKQRLPAFPKGAPQIEDWMRMLDATLNHQTAQELESRLKVDAYLKTGVAPKVAPHSKKKHCAEDSASYEAERWDTKSASFRGRCKQ